MSWLHPPLGFSNAVQKCLVCAHESAVRPGVGEYYDCLCSPLPARGAGECHSHPHLQTLVREQENAMAICATPVRAWGDAAAARALQLQLCGRVVHPSSQACASRWGEEHNGLCQCLLQVLPPYYTPCTPQLMLLDLQTTLLHKESQQFSNRWYFSEPLSEKDCMWAL